MLRGPLPPLATLNEDSQTLSSSTRANSSSLASSAEDAGPGLDGEAQGPHTSHQRCSTELCRCWV